jgi:hypothetical protein
MIRHRSIEATTQPERRPLKIFTSDPMLGNAIGNITTIQVPNEGLKPGPVGSRLAVVDFDGTNDCYYRPVDLDERSILMQGGLDPSESDPRFHQQMVYAVGMKVIENFERALGRRIYFNHERLRLFPHAFFGANAFYDSKRNAIFFGYFSADGKNPGPNLPGQTVFTCLSHDIISHEMTHAIVDRLRPFFKEPSNRDVRAFHEGFSDIVAIFQHFSFQELLRDRIQKARGDIRSPGLLVELAQQFGFSTGKGQALRSAMDAVSKRTKATDAKDASSPIQTASLYKKATESHERGSILVAAVFEAFFTVYQKRIEDLIRISTGGSGKLPEGDLHPDLVNRISLEASRTAQSILNMCIRAFGYLPPVDVTFGDYLRALVTADREYSLDDDVGQRTAMIEGFRCRGVYPESVRSLAEESLAWPRTEGLDKFPSGLLFQNLDMLEPITFSRTQAVDDALGRERVVNMLEAQTKRYELLHKYAARNAEQLDLNPDLHIWVRGFHPSFRVGRQGQLLIEIVAQFIQTDSSTDSRFGGCPFRGGTTVIASADGKVKYVISKPIPSKKLAKAKQNEGWQRLEKQASFIEQCDLADPWIPWSDSGYWARRRNPESGFRAIHQGVLK